MEKIRLGILGVGNMGTGHMRNIKAGLCPEVEVTGIADIDPARLDATLSILLLRFLMSSS